MRKPLTHVLVWGLLLVVAAGRSRGAADPPAEAVPLVTATFNAVDLPDALYRLFVGTKLRYDAPQDVKEPFSASIKEVPLERALRIILEPHGLVFEREGDVYHVRHKENYLSVADRLAIQARDRDRAFWRLWAGRPARPVERPTAHYMDLSAAGGSATGYGRPAWGPPQVYYPPSFNPPPGDPLRVGPLSIPMPSGFRKLPGGGWQVAFPSSGEIWSNGMRIPTSGGGALTVGHK